MKWLNVQDLKPIACIPVLAYSSGADRIYIASMPNEPEFNEHWTICEDSSCFCTGCTAPIDFWMALPESPKGE